MGLWDGNPLERHYVLKYVLFILWRGYIRLPLGKMAMASMPKGFEFYVNNDNKPFSSAATQVRLLPKSTTIEANTCRSNTWISYAGFVPFLTMLRKEPMEKMIEHRRYFLPVLKHDMSNILICLPCSPLI